MLALEKVVNEAIAKAIAEQISESLQTEFKALWTQMMTEFVASNQAVDKLTDKIAQLDKTVTQQTLQLEAFGVERGKLHQASAQATELLQAARKELGIVS